MNYHFELAFRCKLTICNVKMLIQHYSEQHLVTLWKHKSKKSPKKTGSVVATKTKDEYDHRKTLVH